MPPLNRRLPRRLAAVFLALLSAGAWASPATDLYAAATTRVLQQYYGWSGADLRALSDKYAAVLAERCAPAGESCDYATARAVLGDLFGEVGDPHTSVRDAEGALRLREVAQNLAVSRTGVRVVRVDGGLLVVSVMPGSPAEGISLRPGDLLTTVNGAPAGRREGRNTPVGPAEFVRLERAGDPLRVNVQRAGRPEWALDLTTRVLQARDEPTLSWAGADRRTAVITYPSFLPDDAAEQFLSRLQDAQSQGARELVVDLRFNGGGSLAECVAAASVFAPVEYRMQFRGGTQVYQGVNGRHPRAPGRPPPPDAPPLWKGPAAVLVGPNTASCAEVFAYYAQRAGALVVGEATRGVGNSGITFDELPDGGVLSVTVLRAYAPDGQPLPARITPDVSAPLDVSTLVGQGRDTTLEAALRALEDRKEGR